MVNINEHPGYKKQKKYWCLSNTRVLNQCYTNAIICCCHCEHNLVTYASNTKMIGALTAIASRREKRETEREWGFRKENNKKMKCPMNSVRHKCFDTVANFYFASCVAYPLRAIFLGLLVIFEFILAFDKPIRNALTT